MIHRLPLIGALFAGVIVLSLSVMALLSRRPPFVEDGHLLQLTLQTLQEQGELIDPTFLTVLIVVVALAGLTILFVVEFLTPRASRKAGRSLGRGRVQAFLDEGDGQA